MNNNYKALFRFENNKWTINDLYQNEMISPKIKYLDSDIDDFFKQIHKLEPNKEQIEELQSRISNPKKDLIFQTENDSKEQVIDDIMKEIKIIAPEYPKNNEDLTNIETEIE